MRKLVIGFTGQIASGKGTACKYLIDKHGASSHRFSTALRDLCDRLYLEKSRDNLQTMSTAIRKYFGDDMLSHVMAEDAAHDTNNTICIDGIRRPGDVKNLRVIPGFILVHIFADMDKRFVRITKRGENADDATKTFDEFKADHQKEAEIQIADIAKEADELIDNNGTLEDLHQRIDEIIKKYADKN